ncbi:MAG TPA: ATP-binding protein, partial [Opitutaceae bacterium]|nr:ATP-binding protein [Opitutaceae bacterium]
LEQMRKDPPDLLLSDIMMPAMDGFALLKAVRADKNLATTPVILLSARAGEEARVEGMANGADDYLVKPFSARELLARVATHLKISRIRRQAAQLLEESRANAVARAEEMETLMRAVPNPVFVSYDPECRTITGNPAANQMLAAPLVTNFSISGAEDQPKPVIKIRKDGDLLDVRNLPMRLAASTGVAQFNQELEILYPDGRTVWIYGNALPLYDKDGKVRGSVASFMDITERKKQEEILERRVEERTASLKAAVAQLEEFSYAVSHDLRAPLRAMQGYSEALLEEYAGKLDETAMEYLVKIQRASRRLDKLTRDVLIYSKVSLANVVLEPTNLERLIPEIIEQYSSELGIEAQIEVKTPLHSVLADESSLTQSIFNLLGNAVKFVKTGTRPHVKIWTEKKDQSVFLYVEDNGIGIRPEYQKRIFNVFERLHNEKQYSGTGIGLAIVKKAVEKMGGEVGVKSAENEGSVFWLRLPAA